MNIVEVWKKIPGFKSYECCNTGKVRSISRFINWGHSNKWVEGQEIKISSSIGKNVSQYIKLYSKGCKMFKLDSIVLLTFCRDIKANEVIKHKNGLKSDNRLANLEYAIKENPIAIESKYNKRVTFGIGQ